MCNPPPGCRPGDLCAAVCYGTCRKDAAAGACATMLCPPGTLCQETGATAACVAAGEPCGPVTCAAGEVRCNASCGICTLPGELCIQSMCEPVGL